jgi:hypothetical protein
MLRLKRSRHVETGRTQARPWRIERRMEKAGNPRLPRCGHAGPSRSPLGSSRTKIKWVDQPQASNPFEIIYIRDTNSESFPTRWSQNRIGQAHFSLLTECDCLVDGFITDSAERLRSTRVSIRLWFMDQLAGEWMRSRCEEAGGGKSKEGRQRHLIGNRFLRLYFLPSSRSPLASRPKSACSKSAFRLGNRSRMVFHKTSRSIRS